MTALVDAINRNVRRRSLDINLSIIKFNVSGLIFLLFVKGEAIFIEYDYLKVRHAENHTWPLSSIL